MLIDFIMGFAILIDKMSNNFDLILVIVDCLTKIFYYQPIKVIINIVGLTKVIINMVIKYYNFIEFIINK